MHTEEAQRSALLSLLIEKVEAAITLEVCQQSTVNVEEKKLDSSFLQRDTDRSERDCEPPASAQLQYGETDFLNNPD